MSRLRRVPGEGVPPEASSSGYVCLFSALGPGCQGTELGCAAGDGLVLDVPESRRSVIAASVVGVAPPGSSCGRNTDSADRAYTAARVGDAACAAAGSCVGLSRVARALRPVAR